MRISFFQWLQMAMTGWLIYRVERLHESVTQLQLSFDSAMAELDQASEQLFVQVLLVASVIQSELEALLKLFSGESS